MLATISVGRAHSLHPAANESCYMLRILSHLTRRKRLAFRAHAEHVTPARDCDLGLLLCGLEPIRSLLEVLPERNIRVGSVLGHVLSHHPKRESLELERTLAAREGLASERIKLGSAFVRHGVATGR